MQLFQHKTKHAVDTTVHQPLIESPERLWKILRTFFLIAIAVVVGVGIRMYYRVSSDELWQTSEAALSREPINRAKLESVLDRFSKKKTEFELLKTRQPVVEDPSL